MSRLCHASTTVRRWVDLLAVGWSVNGLFRLQHALFTEVALLCNGSPLMLKVVSAFFVSVVPLFLDGLAIFLTKF